MHRSASRFLLLAGFALVAAACADRNPAGLRETPPGIVPPPVHAALQCRIDVRAETLSCGSATPETAPGVSALIIGGQGTNVRLTSSGMSYDSSSSLFRMNVTVENLMAQVLGTTDGVVPAPEGVRVFFHSSPVASEGHGEVSVANADGEGVYTAAAQKYFQYAGLLASGDTTAPREWRFNVPGSVTRFAFSVLIAAPVSGPDASGIVFLEGNNAADTVGAVQSTMLRISVRGPSGNPAANTFIRVKSVPVTSAPFGFEVQTAALGAPFFTDSAVGMTDTEGTIRVWVRMGRRAGPGRLVVTVPDLSLSDTARYTIRPGRATVMRTFPVDTTVLMGSRVPLRVESFDRYSNARNDTVAFTVTTGPGSMEGSEVVAGSSIGQVTALATLGALRDSTFVRVVPVGTVVATVRSTHSGNAAGLYTFSLDGSGMQRLLSSRAGNGYGVEMSVAWLNPMKLVYHDNDWDHTLRQLYVLDLTTGVSARFLPSADSMAFENVPRVSRDGNWVYFSAGTWSRYFLYRARADGTGKERLESDPPWGMSEWGADPSPDGTRTAFVREDPSTQHLFIMDLSTRKVVPLNVPGVSPRWSPDGTHIAYAGADVSGTRLPWVINADGTGARPLSTNRITGDVNWSPNGKYIVAASIFSNRLLIIDVATGAEVLVPCSGIQGALMSVVWKP